jgi:chemotaxis protein methyltransferase CheR
LDRAEALEFRACVARLLGLQFGDDKLDFLGGVLALRAKALGFAAEEYLGRLSLGIVGREEWGALAEALTVTETYFFRNQDHFRALVETALPQRLAVSRQDRPLRIVSAACASGEEPFTLAMILAEAFPGLAPGRCLIMAVDASPAMLKKASEGLYSTWALRETPDAMKEKYFSAEGRLYRLREDIRSAVQFEQRNLAEANPDLWRPGSLDAVFCRNLLMYLEPEAAVALVERMARALAPGGFLFLGYAETLRGLSRDFHLCHTHDTFYYRRLDSEEEADLSRTASIARDVGEAPLAATAWNPGLPWVDTIARASTRIADLDTASALGTPRPASAVLPAERAGVSGQALDFMRHERFAEALDSLGARPPGGGAEDGDSLLLRAVLLTNLGRLPEARAVCQSLLAADEFNAGAHYVMALCCEHAGDDAAAAEEDRTAVYLDATFSLPCLHLGLLARRMAEGWRTRGYLERALQLLAREDAARILLFGGGFSRDGLVEICRSALHSAQEAR